jgi:Mrp family chromosome partitioning ATPase
VNIIQKAMQAAASQRPREGTSVIVEAVAAAQAQAQRAKAQPVPPQAPLPPAGDSPDRVRFSNLSHNGFFGPEGDDPRQLAEIRHMKRSILRGAFSAIADGPSNVIAITSALPEAGKTYLAASLAQALTLERDRTALLIDGDDVRGTISKALGQVGEKGFFDVLHDRAVSPEDAILPTDMTGLSFMPCGGRFSDSLELLTSQRATEVVAAISRAEPNRLAIIDCPPLLGTPNGAALASLAGQVLVVVEAGVTDSTTLAKALELLSRDRPIALVINKVPRSGLLSSRVGSYYYYGARD